MCIVKAEASSCTVHCTLPCSSDPWYCSEGQRHLSSIAYGVYFLFNFLPGEVLQSVACKATCYSSVVGRLVRVICQGAQVLTGMSLFNPGIRWFTYMGNMMLPHNAVYKH